MLIDTSTIEDLLPVLRGFAAAQNEAGAIIVNMTIDTIEDLLHNISLNHPPEPVLTTSLPIDADELEKAAQWHAERADNEQGAISRGLHAASNGGPFDYAGFVNASIQIARHLSLATQAKQGIGQARIVKAGAEALAATPPPESADA